MYLHAQYFSFYSLLMASHTDWHHQPNLNSSGDNLYDNIISSFIFSTSFGIFSPCLPHYNLKRYSLNLLDSTDEYQYPISLYNINEKHLYIKCFFNIQLQVLSPTFLSILALIIPKANINKILKKCDHVLCVCKYSQGAFILNNKMYHLFCLMQYHKYILRNMKIWILPVSMCFLNTGYSIALSMKRIVYNVNKVLIKLWKTSK